MDIINRLKHKGHPDLANIVKAIDESEEVMPVVDPGRLGEAEPSEPEDIPVPEKRIPEHPPEEEKVIEDKLFNVTVTFQGQMVLEVEAKDDSDASFSAPGVAMEISEEIIEEIKEKFRSYNVKFSKFKAIEANEVIIEDEI